MDKCSECRYNTNDFVCRPECGGCNGESHFQPMTADKECNYIASIMVLQSGKYLIEENANDFKIGEQAKRILFYDEAEAESVLEKLNDISELCFVLVRE